MPNTIIGTEGDDRIVGTSGNDSISGGAGNDVLSGGPPSSSSAIASRYIIQTVAGNGRPSLGDGGPATAATLAGPDRVLAVGGVVYIADTENNRVAEVDAGGIIHTVAGSVSAENQTLGDGGLATDAVVRFPHGLFVTAAGLYIGDHSYTVRLVDNAGIIHHAAEPNRADFILPWAIAVDAAGHVYIADRSGNRVLRSEPDGSLTVVAGTGVAGTTGDSGPGTQAEINGPSELRFDNQGHLLIGSAVGPLRQLDLSTGVITTRLPNTMVHFDFDPSGAFIVARGNEVLRVNATSGAETVIAGSSIAGFGGDGGPATAALFNSVEGISVDAAGDIFVTDTGNNRVREITPDGLVHTFAGGGPSVASLNTVMDSQGIAFDPWGHLFLTDFQHHQIRRVMADGSTVVVAGTGTDATSGDGGAAINAAFDHPSILRFDNQGRMYFLDSNYGTAAVRMIQPGADGVVAGAADEIITTIAGRNVDRSLADHGHADGGPARDAVFVAARDFIFNSKGQLIIADWQDNRIRMVTPGADGVFNGGSDEIITTVGGEGDSGQTGDGGLATAAHIEAPSRLAIDAHDNIYVFAGVNTPDVAIRKIDGVTGVITTLARGMYNLTDMVVDHADRLFYSNGAGEVFQVDTTSGAITLVAGSEQTGFAGDGGDAIGAMFRGASWLAVGGDDSLYVVDNGNFRVRKLVDSGQALSNGGGDNTIFGGAGDDTITTADGTNYLRGDDGNDSIVGGIGFDDINGNKGDDTIDGGAGGGDWLVGGQGNDVISSRSSDDILYGNLGNDTLHGGAGNEIIRGGQGDDSLSGGSGNDWISGDRGNDTLSGGAGADTFHTFSGAGIDRVLDFNVAEGDRVQVDAGTSWMVKQVGADTVIDMGNGDQMILVGVQASTLTGNWIFNT